MLFNSIDFAIFLPVVFLLYWFVVNRSLKLQNMLVVAASYLFYGWWDYRFLSLIIISTLVDFTVGKMLAKSDARQRRRLLLIVSLVVNIGMLGFFKYYNFFQENFIAAFSFFGYKINGNSLNIILPVGISFYTFQTLSYTIDVYRRKLEPTKDFIAFAAFVSFFPQLVAGPIERAKNLLPQFNQARQLDYALASDGMRQILWGLFKKIVIADNCAYFANLIFESPNDLNGSTLWLGALFFAFQIYGDFSGYSDIAIGTARLFGFDLMRNFAYPYFSRDIAEFWRRWHISLSTWFRDYLYIPLGGSRGGTWMRIRNTFIIFVVSGFWHGANWTFIVWGALNALYFLPLMLMKRNRNNLDTVAAGRVFASFKELGQIILTFALTLIAWVFFRAESVGAALDFLAGMFSFSTFELPMIFPWTTILLVAAFIIVEWLQRNKQHGLELDNLKIPVSLRWGAYLTLAILIATNFSKGNTFIYFQF